MSAKVKEFSAILSEKEKLFFNKNKKFSQNKNQSPQIQAIKIYGQRKSFPKVKQ
ncbi:MAG: hypothetical protein LBR26_00610 [Prevotella sp.]|jgi:hypothetical protein|nr:hypothetical protein [Prevotella sp.]